MIYLGLTVLTEEPNRRDEPTHTLRRKKTRIDSITGPFSEIEQGPAQRQSRPFNWYMPDRASIDAFVAFRSERCGRLVPFWLPTWHHDFTLTGIGLAATASLTIQNIHYARHQFNPPTTWRRHLAFIQIGQGVQFIRRIDNAVEAGNTEVLTLSSATGIDIVPGAWMLSFLTLVRLDADMISMHWHSPTLAEAALTVIELPQEMPLVSV